MSICTINSIYDIDYDVLGEEISKKLIQGKKDFVKLRHVKLYYDGEGIKNYKVSTALTDEIFRLGTNVEMLKGQNECNHGGIRFHENVGHDSHKEYFRTYCTICNLTIEDYSI